MLCLAKDSNEFLDLSVFNLTQAQINAQCAALLQTPSEFSAAASAASSGFYQLFNFTNQEALTLSFSIVAVWLIAYCFRLLSHFISDFF